MELKDSNLKENHVESRYFFVECDEKSRTWYILSRFIPSLVIFTILTFIAYPKTEYWLPIFRVAILFVSLIGIAISVFTAVTALIPASFKVIPELGYFFPYWEVTSDRCIKYLPVRDELHIDRCYRALRSFKLLADGTEFSDIADFWIKQIPLNMDNSMHPSEGVSIVEDRTLLSRMYFDYLYVKSCLEKA